MTKPSADKVVGTEPGMLVSQELRKLIHEGCWHFPTLDVEKQIQPSSFDLAVGDKCYLVPPDFRGKDGVRIATLLHSEYASKAYKIDTETGFIAKRGFTWLIPLEGEFSLPDGFYIYNSPKSTHGRLGNLVRLVADDTEDFDVVEGPWTGKLYAVLEPHTFDMHLFPGVSMNQIRVFCGPPHALSDSELKDLCAQEDIVYMNNQPVSYDELILRRQIHKSTLYFRLDLVGNNTYGVIGLQAKPNPEHVDLRRSQYLDVLDYYKLLVARKDQKIEIPPFSENSPVFLLATMEQVRVPIQIAGRGLAAEYTSYSRRVGVCALHEAGFFDPGFGYGKTGEFLGASTVLEVNNKEYRPLTLRHGQRVGGFKYFWTRHVPDKVYGYSGNSYQSQIGVRPAKQFIPIDFASIRSRLEKQHEKVLAINAHDLFNGERFEGFKSAHQSDFLTRILKRQESFVIKNVAEHHLELKQPIPYAFIMNPKTKKFFLYTRTSEPTVLHEARLNAKASIGVGGHILEQDLENHTAQARNTVEKALVRQLTQDVHIENYTLRHVGYINADDSGQEVDRVHFGILYVVEVPTDSVLPKSGELANGKMVTLDEAKLFSEKFETWSRIALEQVEKYLGK